MRLRFGPLEILIVAVVILVLFGVSRLSGLNKGSGGKKNSSSERAVAKKQSPPIKHPGLQLFGISVIAIGLVLLGISYGLLKLIAPWGIWAIVLIGAGVLIIALSRRR